jgi:putative oxidoreductase
MTLPALANFTDEALLLLRLMIGLVFFTSGWKHATDPDTRSKDIEMSKGFTRFLGIAECAGALGVLFGLLTQFAAIGLILIMLGSIQKKIVTWKTGFWGKHGTDGWSYDSMMLIMNLVVATTGGGSLVLESLFRSVSPHA